MMKLNNSAKSLGKRNKNIFVLIDLKREMKEDIVFVMKAKTRLLNASLILYSIKNKFDLENINELG